MEVNSSLYNLEFIGESMEQKDRGSHCCTDLELAAEIGKNLLERNKELEVMLKSSHQYLEEQTVKNEFLSKQLETLRELHDSQVRTCEQMESTALDLQKNNKELQSETAVLRKRYQSLVQTVDCLESKCDEYKTQLEELQIERMRLQREMAGSLSLKLTPKENGYELESDDESDDTEKDEKVLGFKKDIEILNDRIMKLKRQHSVERRRREELEIELSDLIHENQQLDKELLDFAEQAKVWQQLENEVSCLSLSIDNSSEHVRQISESTEDESFVLVENELDRQSSAMSDQSEVEVLSPSHEVKSPLKQNSTSFLSELGSQYHELVQKYDSLVKRCKSEGIVQDIAPIPTVQRAIQTSPLDEVPVQFGDDTSQQSSASGKAREYRQLFAQIYSKIQESKKFNPADKTEKKN
ncbi:cerebellar degeneration-related protein 2-like isoform X1 [Orbicella faveolata]|uniref:cerebellar degeneration-related protein 2-like isoform X1 n=1 Tax=Orbicella faveolata TaxID=48498 RepID=UPI0009E198FF|nr:cerebellar degeneration-related protein 2-like isoform X1 [Orbicella faveolata]